MKQFPLVRLRRTNEHIMAAVFFVLVMYQIPFWVGKPTYILNFLTVLAVGLLIDTILNLLRYKRLVCSVSASVTVGVILALFPAIPVWGGIAGTAAALILGKHFFGGTGKNILNPAIIGVLLLGLLFQNEGGLFPANYALIPAMLLSLAFIGIRPYASIGMMFGMLLSMVVNDTLSIANIISSGVVFWGCIIVTDPVTVSYRPFIGALGGFAAGFAPIFIEGHFSARTMAILVLGLNIISFLADRFIAVKGFSKKRFARIAKPYSEIISDNAHMPLDMKHTGIQKINMEHMKITSQDILRKICDNEVVGLGGAAFPTHEKIQSVMACNEKKKFFVINAVECDPGLVHDYWLLRQYPNEIYKGIQLVCGCIKFDKVVLATKDISGLEFPGDIDIVEVPGFYPIGAERILIENTLKIKLPHDVIPANAGILVLNVQTLLSVYEAVYLNRKADSKYITVANLNKKQARVLKVKLGSKISEIANAVYPGEGPIFTGGGLMAARRIDDNEEVIRTTNFIAISQFPYYKESVLCSKCAICVRKCPSGLEVYKIAELVDNNNLDAVSKYNIKKCISCGTCSYYCLAGRNLSYKMKIAKEYR
ncbi:RnfABCDGE type electron transport complex subunit D [Acetivibrio straminisolvens]|jgi:Na+-translocating ferredoxin:NAD+ oxidoreductase RnfD subunit/ferredoxin|uniref:RnfABCDGE type electron transport complex subunit D n=2 Tax=Acetivibrio straminisolvens TaxID=253314 RepID=UPI00223ED947|nr:RnfABCDGE type electron transport complex subunit D [Acetivibrio straminisolvens]